jgi:post-segregation antitoxin (ccd killing protein)
MSDIVERLRLCDDQMVALDHLNRPYGLAKSLEHEAAAEIERLRAERAEAVAALALYRAENGCTRGQRTTQWCGEATKLRRAWLRVIQAENQCPASGGGCFAKRCGCLAEMELLIGDAGHD